jgi:hypothetical protein
MKHLLLLGLQIIAAHAMVAVRHLLRTPTVWPVAAQVAIGTPPCLGYRCSRHRSAGVVAPFAAPQECAVVASFRASLSFRQLRALLYRRTPTTFSPYPPAGAFLPSASVPCCCSFSRCGVDAGWLGNVSDRFGKCDGLSPADLVSAVPGRATAEGEQRPGRVYELERYGRREVAGDVEVEANDDHLRGGGAEGIER